jgi:glucuronokinase
VASSGPTSSRVPARAGLVGNPSDGFGGAVLAAVVDVWAASVTVTPIGEGLRLSTAEGGVVEWAAPGDVAADVAARGHPPGHEIVTAALQALQSHADRPLPAVAVEWSSTIPRSVGLAGSSAIAVAVIEAVGTIAGCRLDPRVTAALALEAETVGLGIPAGWQDRMVQASRCAVLVDAADMATVDGVAVPAVRPMPDLEVEAIIGWRSADSEESASYHGELRRRADRATVTAGLQEMATLARRAAACAEGGDIAGLVELVDASWRTRRTTMPLHPAHERLVEAARAAGVVATSPGSGGSVVALPTNRRSREEAVAALAAAGAEVVAVRLR